MKMRLRCMAILGEIATACFLFSVALWCIRPIQRSSPQAPPIDVEIPLWLAGMGLLGFIHMVWRVIRTRRLGFPTWHEKCTKELAAILKDTPPERKRATSRAFWMLARAGWHSSEAPSALGARLGFISVALLSIVFFLRDGPMGVGSFQIAICTFLLAVIAGMIIGDSLWKEGYEHAMKRLRLLARDGPRYADVFRFFHERPRRVWHAFSLQRELDELLALAEGRPIPWHDD